MGSRSLLLVALVAAVSGCSPFQTARMGTAYISNTLCTAAFVSHVDVDRTYDDALRPITPIGWLSWAVRYRVDREHQEVRTTVFGGFEQASRHRTDAGCQSEFPAAPPTAEAAMALPAQPAPPLLPPMAGDAVVAAKDPRLRAAVDAAFAPSSTGDGPRTKVLVVVQNGRILAERYGEGYGMNTRLPGYSDTKSIVSALIGILVRQGRLAVDQPAPIPEWSSPADPRHSITIANLLRMQSGLEWDESLAGGPDDAARSWFLAPDQAALPASRPLAHPPGLAWQYNSGNTLLLSRIIRNAVGGTQADVQRFMHRELFDPLGMEAVEMEFDRTGTPMGAAGMSATARDWARFGVLYADDGVVGGRRVLPEGWVDYSAAPVDGAFVGYGAGFWTNRGDSYGAQRRRGWGISPHSFFASGHLGQIILIVPEDHLVIARFGWSFGPSGGFEEMFPQFAAITAAVRAGAQ